MTWRVEFAGEVEDDTAEAAAWYEKRQPGLGGRFIAEVIRVWDLLAIDPLTGSRRHPRLDVRWRYSERFPYRVVYQVDAASRVVRVVAVLHAARHATALAAALVTVRTPLTPPSPPCGHPCL